MTNINPAIFRAYDIRGKAKDDLNDAFAYALGQAFASELATKPTNVAIGRDCRLSSPRLHEKFSEGVLSTGASIIDIGVVPSPLLYFAAHHLKCQGAVIITGSHNPADENGFKFMRNTESFHGDDIQQLKKRILNHDFLNSSKEGTIQELDLHEPYLDAIKQSLNLGPKRPKVVVDAGNGTGGPLSVKLYRDLGFDVVPLFCEMDGSFPNHHPDPTVEKNLSDLKAKVLETKADVGLAFDGDSDRLGAIDGKGRVLWGDQLMILFGRSILKELPGAKFIGEVKCSQTMYDELKKSGGYPIMWKVGHSLIKSKLKAENAALAGEMSGHLFFADRYFGFDDGIYAGARLLEILSQGEMSLVQHYDSLPVSVNTPEIRVPCPDHQKFELIKSVASKLKSADNLVSILEIDGVRANFGFGWGLVRASNTQPSLVTRFEASDHKKLNSIQSLFSEAIQQSKRELGI